MRYLRVTATNLVRVRLTYAANDLQEVIEFDIARAESLVLVADSVELEAKAYTGTATVRWASIDTGAWAPARLQFNVPVAGSVDSDADPSVAPPAAAVGIRILQRAAGTYELKLQRGATVLARFDETTMPVDGAPLGPADRVVLTSADPLRVVYDLRL